jgi:isoleucyl-tRNA synthetase
MGCRLSWVEKMLGITKDDIGKTISVSDYNDACRREVMKYTDLWEDLTHKMGYWVDMDHPYITYDNRYIETLWWILKEFYNKGLLYKGYTIQPYSPAAGTGLSSHELNQPGCYRDVKDTTVTALFEVIGDSLSIVTRHLSDASSPAGGHLPLFIMAWTTTPWTLPSNTALCVGPDIRYVLVETVNPYSGEPIRVILAKELVKNYFDEAKQPFTIIGEFSGRELEGIRYQQLINWVQPKGDAFRVILGDLSPRRMVPGLFISPPLSERMTTGWVRPTASRRCSWMMPTTRHSRWSIATAASSPSKT